MHETVSVLYAAKESVNWWEDLNCGCEEMTARVNRDICYGDAEEFAKDMVKMINAKEFSDIQFLVGEERQVVHAHRCLLASRCEVFKAMLAIDKKEASADRFILSDLRPKTFLSLLEYMYTNCCSMSSNSVIDIMSSSIEYGLDGLTRLCVRFMKDSITVENVCEYIQGGVTYNQTTLLEFCMDFIEAHTAEVFSSSGFNELSDDALAFILQSDKLMLEEEQILDKVTEWASIVSVVSGSIMGEVASKVIGHVRFALLSPDALSRAEQENNKKAYIPVTLISGAWKYHALKSADPDNPQSRPRVGTRNQI